MSYRDMRNFTEMMRALGYPRLISMENFRSPNFALVSEILQWLVRRYDPNAELPMDTDTEQDRVLFIKSVAQFMATKAHIKLNGKKLYGADGYAVKELLKIASMLYDAMRSNQNDRAGVKPATIEQFDITSKTSDLKLVRQLASEITEHGSSLSALLKQEVELQEMRVAVIARPLELDEIERELKTSINQVHGKTRESVHRLENLAGDEANLEARIEKKKQELERNQKRLKSLQNVRPAFMDEYEKLEGELKRHYEEYIERFRNLTYLEHQLKELNRIEQEKLEATNLSLQEMQRRMQEQEQHLHGGINDTFALTGDSGVEHDDEEEDEDEEDGEDDDEEEEEEEGEIRGKGGRRVFGNMTGEGLDDEGGSSLTTEADSEDIDNGHLLGQDGDEDDEDVLGAYGDEHDDDGGDGGIPDMGSDDDF
ncbi:clusterin-associated protein 1-like [Oscarella lobularis]|uniref:clusterin-associated protein 1-like n=1 Tax=Oscarella lobularis TaxID=121494 RepID=UPI00331392FB